MSPYIAMLVKADYVPLELHGQAARFIRDTFNERARGLGWSPKTDDTEDTRLLRQAIVPLVATDGEDKTLADQAGTLARRWLEDHKAVDPDIAPSVLVVAARFGNQDLFDRLLAAVRKEKDSRTRIDIFDAIGAFRDPVIAKQALALLLTGEFDARESLFSILRGSLENPETRELPFEFVRQNIDVLVARLPHSAALDYDAYLPVCGRVFCNAAREQELKSLFEPRVKDYSGGPRILAQVLERIEICIGLSKVLGPSLTEFLRNY